MSQKTFKRYWLVYQKITNKHKPFPSKQNILNELINNNDVETSPRTVDRVIEKLRYEFDLEIKYNRTKKGYYLDEIDKDTRIEDFGNFLKQLSDIQELTDTLLKDKENIKYISFSNSQFKGIEHINTILKAIKESRKIILEHLHFETNEVRKYTIKPYLLREYLDRWYVVGMIENKEFFTTFGIDRIENLEITDEQFEKDKKLDPRSNFEDIIGVIYSVNEIQKVVLSFSPLQGKYIKSLPIHKSQKILIDNDQECRISLFIKPNYEFSQQLRLYGDSVKIIEPLWLIGDFKNNIKNILKKYE